jgi:hypothetical protein
VVRTDASVAFGFGERNTWVMMSAENIFYYKDGQQQQEFFFVL